jgi:hypothetical protein
MEITGWIHDPAALTSGMNPGTLEAWLNPEPVSNLWRRENLPFPEFEPRIVQPIAQTL